jgi:hypothetical protein
LADVQEGPISTAQANALVVALIYERAGEISFHGSRGVNFRSLHVLARRGLLERDEHGGFRLTEAGRGLARSLKGELSSPT